MTRLSASEFPRISIVAYSGVFPGARTLDDFWANVESGTDCSREVPPDRWTIPPTSAYSPEVGRVDRVYSTRGYFLNDVPIETEGLSITRGELSRLDPSVRLAVTLARRAWIASQSNTIDPNRVGVILGHIALPTEFASNRAREILDQVWASGTTHHLTTTIDSDNRFVAGWPAIVAARALGLGGGAFTLDAACASSLYALKLACDALQSGRADAMLAGGLSRPDCLYTQMGFSQLRALASNRCAPFDSAADGLVVGEGGGVFVLKRLDDAERDGDTIHGVIAGIGLSNDRAGNLLAPASEGQLRAMRAAYREAGWSPEDVSLIECHATGTPVGDATEFQSLQQLWGTSKSSDRCVIGSVKSTVGHLLTGASSAGLIKVLSALRHDKLPPTANFQRPGNGIDLDRGPFRILRESEDWSRPAAGPRRAAISGFGFGGINAHLLLEEYQPRSFAIQAGESLAPPPCTVAVIGLAIHVGSATNSSDFARHLFCADPVRPNLGRIESIDVPLGRFAIPPRELEAMLPQQTLALMSAASALDDAGLQELPDPEQTGVYLGLGLDQNTTNFHFRWSRPENERDDIEPLTADRTMGALASVAASRIARAIRAGGPSFALSSEETSGAHAMQLAVRALQRGDISLAIAGAVDLPNDLRACLELPPELRPIDAAVTLVLERLDDAHRANRHIYAVIDDFSNCNKLVQNSTASGFLVSSRGSAALSASATGSFDIEEAIGYAGAAGSMIAVATAVLALDRCAFPADGPRPTQHCLTNRAEGPRIATALMSDVDGNKIVVALSESNRSISTSLAPMTEQLFLLSGDTTADLLASVDRLVDLTKRTHSNNSTAYQWWQDSDKSPRQHRYGLSLVADDREQLNQFLDFCKTRLSVGALPTEPPVEMRDRIFCSDAPLAAAGTLAFVYPGSGNHFEGMGRELALAFPAVMKRQESENELYRAQWRPDVIWRAGVERIDARSAIFAQVVFGSLVSDILAEFGVKPNSAIGLSLGTSASFFGLRAWTDRDEMYRRMQGSRLFTDQLAGPCEAAQVTWNSHHVDWHSGVVTCGPREVRQAIADLKHVYLLTINTPDECVIGGERSIVQLAVSRLGATFVPLSGVSIAHCEVVNAVSDAYRELHRLPTTAPSGMNFYHQITHRRFVPDMESAADAVLSQASNTVDVPALIEAAYADGVRFFAEIGPGASATRMISRILDRRPFAARSASLGRGDEVGGILRLLAHLHAERFPVDLAPLFKDREPVAATFSSQSSMKLPVRQLPFELRRRQDRRVETVPTIEPNAEIFAADRGDLFPAIANAQLAVARAHGEFLQFAIDNQRCIAEVLEQDASPHYVVYDAVKTDVYLDRAQCLAFAVGQVGPVLGEQYAAIDQFPTRVRLPDEPLMLVDRILEVEGVPLSLTNGRVVTAHDVTRDRWYLDHGRMPVCIAVEAGQADLFLSGYLGIDLHTRGLAVYRLLDAIVTFHGDLPTPTSIVHYDIHIDRFFRQGETQLFRFRFVGTVDGQPLLTMTEGCAGFFTSEELAAGKGIVHTELDRRHQVGKKPDNWQPFVSIDKVESYDDEQVEALRKGDLAGCFGSAFDGLALRNPLRLPGGRMHLVDRITHLDPNGGRFGLGLIRGEADVRPDDWYLTCHFVDDMVMPGTLMYECCLHTLRIYLMRLGWVGKHDAVAWQPVPEMPGRLKCRGQVTATTRKVVYEVAVKEIGYRPEPYAIADVLMFADGKPIVEMLDMSVRLTGTDESQLSELWSHQSSKQVRPAIYDTDRILAFAVGDPSFAFGEPYRVFDHDRVIARLPGPPYQFLDRIVHVEGPPWVMQAGAAAEAEYDVPPDAWYFAANGRPVMPFAVLLEIALQPCGWLAAYVGSALTSDTDLSFRNLGGKAIQHQQIGPDFGRLTTRTKLTNVSSSGGMIIQHFELAVRDSAGQPVYDGTTYFGFFSKAALAQQVGLRDAPPLKSGPASESTRYSNEAPFPDEQIRMIDTVTRWLPDGGPAHLGLIEGTKVVNPAEWFFKAHFYQDPVVPGSLGLESFLQLLNIIALRRWGPPPGNAWQSGANGQQHEWIYRGQVLPSDRKVTVRAEVTKIDDRSRLLQANGLLYVDGRPIYRMTDFTLQGWGT